MGARVNVWLFGNLFILLAVALYGANLGSLGGSFASLIQNTSLGKVSTTIFNQIYGQVPGIQPALVASPINPLPNQNLLGGIPFPTWLLTMGVFVWGLAVLWEVYSQIRGGKSLRQKSWGWILAPVTLMAFIMSSNLGAFLDKSLYSPVMSHFIIGAQSVAGINPLTPGTIDPKTFGNPLWLVAVAFGVGNTAGGITIYSVLANATAGLATTLAPAISDLAGADPTQAMGAVLQHLLSPSILIELAILTELAALAVGGTLILLFFDFLPLFALPIISNPFSLDNIAKILKVSLRAISGLALIMFADIFMVIINHTVSGGIVASFIGGWFLSFLNIIIIGVTLWLLYKISIAPIFDYGKNIASDLSLSVGGLAGLLAGGPMNLNLSKRFKDTSLTDYKGNFSDRVNQQVMDMVKWTPNSITPDAAPPPYNIKGTYDVDYMVEPNGNMTRIDKSNPDWMQEVIQRGGSVVPQERKAVKFNTVDNAQWAWKMLHSGGNVNAALAYNGPLEDQNFKWIGTSVEFTNEPKQIQLTTNVLNNMKVYRYFGGKYINSEGIVVPEEMAKRGLIV